MKGYKAFDKGLKCKGFQYKEGEEYEIDEIKICNRGFHFCENPLDVLEYYDLCESEFADIEALGKIESEGNKSVTDNIKINAKLDLSCFIKASFDFLWNKCNKKEKDNKNYSQLASSGDYSQLASSGDYSQLASSGDHSKLASSGYSSKLASSGYSSKLASSGGSSKLASSGHYSQLASSGHCSQLASSGYSSKLASSGDHSKLASSGYSSKLASSGYSSKLASSGYSSKLASSGDHSKLASSGEDSVVAGVGIQNKAKGVKGNWIVLVEWIYDSKLRRHVPKNVKSIKIDGKKIKENIYYELKNGKFVEWKN